MPGIVLKNVSVEFPVYNLNARSLKKQFIRLATGGAVVEDANNRVVVNALKNVTLSINKGDRVGIIGHNGSGKSTFLRLLAGIYEPTSGDFHIDGQICPILDILHGIEAEFNGNDNIVSRSTILGRTRKQIKDKLHEIKEFSGLGDYLSMPIRTYSSGMMVRLAFAISTSIMPDILLVDEVFGAGDADFLLKAKDRLNQLVDQSNIVVMATHSDELIKEFCNKALLFESGEMKYFGDVEKALEIYHSK